jgi:hypothetical protein
VNSGRNMEISLHHDRNPHFRPFNGFLGFFAWRCVLIFNRWLKTLKRNFKNTERPSPDCAFGSPERGANGKFDVEGLSSLEQFSGALVPGFYFQDLLVEIPCIVCSPHDLTNLADMQKSFSIAGVCAEDVDKDS